jgi:hypothetical protein
MEEEEEKVITISKEQFRKYNLEKLLKKMKESGFDTNDENKE